MRVPQGAQPLGFARAVPLFVAPPCIRRCASLDAAIPWLYLHGVSSGQMRQAVTALVGMKQRGFTRPAKLAVGDGALGFWAALSEGLSTDPNPALLDAQDPATS